MSRTDINTGWVQKGTTVATDLTWTGGTPKYYYTSRAFLASASEVQEIRGGSTTPKFNSANPPNPLPVNPFSYYKHEKTYWTGYISERSLFTPMNATSVDSKTVGNPAIGDTYPSTPITPADVDNAKRIAIEKFHSQVKDMDVNLGQVAAERHMTWDLVATAAKRAHGAMKDLRSGNIVGAASHLGVTVGRRRRSRFNKSYKRNQAEAVASGWLELQYGWKPLLQDVYGAIDLASKTPGPEYHTIETKKTIKRELQRTIDNIGSQAQYYTGSDQTILGGSARCTVRVGCTFTVSNSTLKSAAGMGLTNPALLAWELLPFSFVADWFLPIGNYISSWDSTLGLSFYSGYVTTFKKFEGHGTAVASKVYLPTLRQSMKLCTCRIMDVTVTREVLGAFPSISLPRFKNPASATHAANAIGLLVQYFRGK